MNDIPYVEPEVLSTIAKPGVSASQGGAPEFAPKRRTWQDWRARRSKAVHFEDGKTYRMGIDAGSKTLKLVILDDDDSIVLSLYHRHRSDVRSSFSELLSQVVRWYGDVSVRVAVTGSAGIALAEQLGLPFVQEVVATTNAVKSRFPDVDCIIELGGEDAKITYLSGNVEQRMNATCAGGTGDFIDGIASMLGVKTRDISSLALGSQQSYPIASRCAVFARTDVRPLINAGARKADIAQSALDAVVRQTLGGLACGRPIRGNVVFLGGPLEHIPALVLAFRKKLGLNANTGIKPPDAHLFAAIGAIESVDDAPAFMLSKLQEGTTSMGAPESEAGSLPPLFETDEQYREFVERHEPKSQQTRWLDDTQGPLFLGFDAGSTTMKYVLLNKNGNIVASDYREVEGDTFDMAKTMLEDVLRRVEGPAYSFADHYIAHATVTGYGEDLLIDGLGFDSGVVETVAHLRAAQNEHPDVSFVLDIGGQDMKALWVQDGVVVDAVLNEACSSGCGAFVQSSARAVQLPPSEFARKALQAKHPLDLGAKCTVFMTSRVRQAQKAGAPTEDIAAGIAYSVVNNVMTRIIGRSHSRAMGDVVVVQGGTFKSDAVLRAFELVAGVQAIRPSRAHLMGAYGAALVARERWLAGSESADDADLSKDEAGAKGRVSSLVSLAHLKEMNVKRSSTHCTGCGNACAVSVVDFGDGKRHVSGNRCDRVYEALFPGESAALKKGSAAPNVVQLQQGLIEQCRDFESSGVRGGVTVGILDALGTYESLPFWHELFCQLGFSVRVVDEQAAAKLQDVAAETIPSESVCFPAKLAHRRYAYLEACGSDLVFMPQFERGTRCPVVAGYANALGDNVGWDLLLSPLLHGMKPRGIAGSDDDCEVLCSAINEKIAPGLSVSLEEMKRALQEALARYERYRGQLEQASDRAFEWLAADGSRRLAILSGRPYHADPSVLHDIDRELARLGFAVVPDTALHAAGDGGHREKTAWKPSKHLVRLVRAWAGNPQVEIVALRSFGCGYDAVSFDEAHDVANELHRPFTELKIDDIADVAHIRIRLRTLEFTSSMGKGPQSVKADSSSDSPASAAAMTPDLCSTAKELVQCAIERMGEGDGRPLNVPASCVSCLTDALPFELKHLVGKDLVVLDELPDKTPVPEPDGRMRVGLLGNPLLVFTPRANDDVAELLERLGCQVVFPDPALVAVEDVRYVEQLERFREQGVERVVYLQSFGCLKGHVQSRGALHELGKLFPDMPITVIDYDAESSALNRENRIRLAVS